jgi:hypothetical protein
MLHADRSVSLNGGKQNGTKMSKGFRGCGPATGWATEGSGIYSRQGQWIFICPKATREAVGPHPVSCSTGTRSTCPRDKTVGTCIWPPSSCAVVKNGRNCILACRYVFVAGAGSPLLEKKSFILFEHSFGIGLDF